MSYFISVGFLRFGVRFGVRRVFTGFVILGSALLWSSVVLAAQPSAWQLGFQDSVTENMDRITSFNNFLLILMTVIVLFVLGLMLYAMFRFRESRNPTPSKRSHNTPLEVAWTVIPILILLVIAVPSFRLLFFQRTIPPQAITVKATGYQWYWGYEYPDYGNFSFDSLMLSDELRGSQPRLLATDTAMVIPVDTNIRLQVIASDVLHSWTIPAFGIKLDAVPGRLNETWFRVEKVGTYYGQCSELCGIHHAFMPIRVEVVEVAAFEAWIQKAKIEYADERDIRDLNTPETQQIATMR